MNYDDMLVKGCDAGLDDLDDLDQPPREEKKERKLVCMCGWPIHPDFEHGGERCNDPDITF